MASKRYNYNFIDELSDKLKCSICLDVAEDPKQHEKCGKIFCSECIEKNGTKPCPICRGQSPNYFSDARGAQEIRDLRVKCSNLYKGCQWQGSVGTLEEHLAACECEFVACKYSHIGCEVNMMRKHIKQHEENDDKHHLHLSLQSTAIPTLSHGEYFVFKMTEYSVKKRNNEVFTSDPFYTHSNGYKMQFKIYANGKGSGKDTHLSISSYLLKGPFDSNLQWPFSGILSLSILDPNNETNYFANIFSYENKQCGQVGLSYVQEITISHALLSTYMKNDTIYFRVTVSFCDNLPWLECGKQVFPKLRTLTKLFIDKDPLVFKIKKYTSIKCDNTHVNSRDFFTSPNGYKMFLKIYINGNGDGEGEYVSIYAYMMKGPYDASLSWPFLGTVKFELLNQFSDNHHHTKSLQIVRQDNMLVGHGLGYSRFIKHSDLQCGEKQYLMDDTIYFKVSVTLGNHKPWLACTP